MITSTGNDAVKAARKLSRRQAREQAAAFLVEGPQAVGEAGERLLRLFVTDAAAERHPDVVDAARSAGAEILPVTDRVLASIADTRTPQGLVGVAALDRPGLRQALDRATLVAVLWEAQDPGNVGTVVRSADAAGADAVVLTGGSADPGNPKAARASAGSVFHLPVVAGVSPAAALDAARAAGLRVVATAPDAGQPHTEVDLARPTAVLFGNEARGLPADLVAACDAACHVRIRAPARAGYRGAAESLNLAATAAVVLFEAARQRTVRGSAG